MKPKVLIIDDSKSSRDLIARFLAEEPLEVMQAVSAKNGLQILSKLDAQVALVLLDLNMPDLNGFEFLKAIRTRQFRRKYPMDKKKSHAANLRAARRRDADFHQRLRDLKVMIISGSHDSQDVVRARELGIAGYLVKPLTREALIEKIRGKPSETT